MTALNPDRLRLDFPILSRKIHGKPLVYLDNAATTQKPMSVIMSMTAYYERTNANVHRGVHTLSQEATSLMEQSRDKVAAFIGAPDPATVIFTRNATESINLVAYSWARKNLKPGDEILLTEMEHHSNLIPWQMAAQATGAVLRFIPVTGWDGFLDLSRLDGLLTPRTKLLAVTQMSNVLGTINPVTELARRAHAVGAKVLVDGAQSAPHLAVDVKTLGADFFAFSAHKMLGPTGLGVLWAPRALLETMEPFLGGGDMISQVWPDRATWNELPYKFEAGTPNITGAIAFGAAIDYLNQVGMDNIRAHEQDITGYALGTLKDRFPKIVLHGPADVAQRGGVVSFELPGVHPHDIGTILDREGVAVRAGHHCCQVLMKKFGVAGTARASFYLYNTRAEVDALVASLGQVERLFVPSVR
ncbi:MAG: cysteine desulfurase [Elusimicrobia bacterium]|nr:cysteine desulfurase [Elusimicrobiota bacterium]MBK7545034.1 cysteine desulfurase [Elusimicrobiota bacterium]MBK7574553.1 cysteine desulfurase [Elusimicrobiota bacterium]MBK8126700.1 cysteine desulfurase [Elusimicrobiota bacterium]MBK8423517.1 cysteine desulfurase [Elusimicrobiota bacterium]